MIADDKHACNVSYNVSIYFCHNLWCKEEAWRVNP